VNLEKLAHDAVSVSNPNPNRKKHNGGVATAVVAARRA
jgi:hypothetical protein